MIFLFSIIHYLHCFIGGKKKKKEPEPSIETVNIHGDDLESHKPILMDTNTSKNLEPKTCIVRLQNLDVRNLENATCSQSHLKENQNIGAPVDNDTKYFKRKRGSDEINEKKIEDKGAINRTFHIYEKNIFF